MSKKIVFMGTPEFSVPTLDSLLNSDHKISAVYSQPASKANRGQKVIPSKIEIFAKENSLNLRTPTSLDNDDLQMMKIDISTKDLVSSLAKLTKESGLSGVVCSSEEIKLVREACGKNFKIIVPGIRPEGSDKNDQKRIMTPKEAISLGADHLVIGRPITESKDPRKTAKEIVNSIR